MLEILYQDQDLVAVNKPHGLLVHKSSIAKDVSEYALQILRDQLSQRVYPAHRLDRKTSGVLLFALNEDVSRKLHQLFAERKIEKKYLAIVRGYTNPEETINYPLKRESGSYQEAITNYKTLAHAELPFPLGRHETVRYSLVEIVPETGRMHQIRKHFAHILHPIVGDRPYGCNKQNRFFLQRWNMGTMMLHASSLAFIHPTTSEVISIKAKPHPQFIDVARMMNWEMGKEIK